MANIAYLRVSTGGQSLESQRAALGGPFDEIFEDHGVSGSVLAMQRPQFSKMSAYIRKGDTLHVSAVDRLGRDALDVQATVRALIDMGVTVEIRGLGRIARGAGEIILAVLAQVADMERQRIVERTAAGRDVARASLAATGRTHKGKASLGRPTRAKPADVAEWRKTSGMSIAETAAHWDLSVATVKRYCAAHA